MIKYFINLAKVRGYAEKYNGNKTKEERPLIAAVGTDKTPVYLIFLDVMNVIDGYKLVVEKTDGTVQEHVFLDSDNWIKKIKRVAERYNFWFDEEDLTEEEKNECTAVCNNPECVEFGNQVDIIRDEMGRLICPSCGEEIETSFLPEDEEEDQHEDLDRESLVSLAYTLIDFLLIELNGKFNEDLMENLGIDIEEVESVVEEYSRGC